MIFCLQCQHENRDNARFCAQCGSALMEPAADEAWSRQNEHSFYADSSSRHAFDAHDTGPLEEDVIDFTFPSPDEDDFYDLRSRRRRREARYGRSRVSSRMRPSRFGARRSRRRSRNRPQPPRTAPSRGMPSSYEDRFSDRSSVRDNYWSPNRYDEQRYETRYRRRQDTRPENRGNRRQARDDGYRDGLNRRQRRDDRYRDEQNRRQARDDGHYRDGPNRRQARDDRYRDEQNRRQARDDGYRDSPNRGQARDDRYRDEQNRRQARDDGYRDEPNRGQARDDGYRDEQNRRQARDDEYHDGLNPRQARDDGYRDETNRGQARDDEYHDEQNRRQARDDEYDDKPNRRQRRDDEYDNEQNRQPARDDEYDNEQNWQPARDDEYHDGLNRRQRRDDEPDDGPNRRQRRTYRSDSRPHRRRGRRTRNEWADERAQQADNQRDTAYNRASSVGQGSGFTISSLATANLREISSDDYEDMPVTNGRPYPDEPTPTPFVPRSKANKRKNRDRDTYSPFSSSPSTRQSVQNHQEWAPPTPQTAQEEGDSDYEWQARPYPVAKRETNRPSMPATEATPMRKESEKSQPVVTVVRSEPVAQPTRASASVSQATHEIITEPLSPATSELSPLPIGELLQKRRYVIISLLEQTTTQNIYLVKDRLRRTCISCGSNESKREATQCHTCGTEWHQQAVELPRYLLREVFDQNDFEKQAALVSLNLSHPRLMLPLAAFSEKAYGTIPRFYLLSESITGDSLASLSRPQPETQVLSWGRQLADGLIYLHEQEVACQTLDLKQVMLVEGQAKLSDLSHAQQITPYVPATWQANEVDALGDMLFKLLNPLSLSSPTTMLFERFAHSQDRFMTMHAFADALDETLQQLHEQAKVTHLVGQATDTGQQRTLNQDHLLTLKFEHAYLGASRPIGLYIVADGIGGQAAGEIASQLAANTIMQQITSKVMLNSLSITTDETNEAEPQAPDYAMLLKEACLHANEVLHEQRLQANNDMGTTMVAALVVDQQAYIANVGDSRAYSIRQGEISQLTIDHSLVGRLLSLGQITPEQARTHPQRHVIYRTLGDKPQVEIDIFEKRMQAGDRLVLCTDGLYGMVNDALIQQQAMQATHPQAACEELVLLANQAGGEDNIAVIVIQIEEVG